MMNATEKNDEREKSKTNDGICNWINSVLHAIQAPDTRSKREIENQIGVDLWRTPSKM